MAPFQFYCGDHEKKYTQVFESAKLDGAKKSSLNGRGVEVAVRNATQGEAWVDDLQKIVNDMIITGCAYQCRVSLQIVHKQKMLRMRLCMCERIHPHTNTT